MIRITLVEFAHGGRPEVAFNSQEQLMFLNLGPAQRAQEALIAASSNLDFLLFRLLLGFPISFVFL